MQKQSSFDSGRGVLDPTVPLDIGARSQRQRIIEAMVEICAEKTFAATTIADIVGRASVSRTTFYKHFADKRTCFDAALDVCIEELQGVAERAHAAADPPAEAIRKSIASILEALAANPALAEVALAESLTVDSAVVERYRRLTIPALEQLWTQAGEPLRTYSDARIAFGRVQVLIFDQLSSGRVKRLPELLPEIVYIAVMPFAGHAEALRQARLVAGEQPSPSGAADAGNGR
jgi:AcrR family transcriptional regulator